MAYWFPRLLLFMMWDSLTNRIEASMKNGSPEKSHRSRWADLKVWIPPGLVWWCLLNWKQFCWNRDDAKCIGFSLPAWMFCLEEWRFKQEDVSLHHDGSSSDQKSFSWSCNWGTTDSPWDIQWMIFIDMIGYIYCPLCIHEGLDGWIDLGNVSESLVSHSNSL